MGSVVFERHWVGPFNEQWARELHAVPGQRTTFLQGLPDAEDNARACEALRVLFNGREPLEVTHTLFQHVAGTTVVNSWLGPSIFHTDQRRLNAGPLLKTACELGLDLTHLRRIKLPGGENVIETTELGERIALSPLLNKVKLGLEMDVAGLLLLNGAYLDDATCHALLTLKDVELAQRWLDHLSQLSDLTAGELVRCGSREHVEAETLAYFSALSARETVDATSGQGLRPLCG